MEKNRMPLLDRKCQGCGHQEVDLLERPIGDPSIICPECGQASFAQLPSAGSFHIDGGDACRALDFWDRENSNCDGVYGKSYTKLDLRDKKMGKHVEYSK